MKAKRQRKAAVERILRETIRRGYDPTYDMESEEDHGCAWTALTQQEFRAIVESESSVRSR